MITNRHQWRCFVAVLLLSGLVGCAHGTKIISDDLKRGIAPGLTFKMVIENPKGSVGKTVLWGGTIIKTTVSNEGTLLEILQKPLGRKDRPLQTDESDGRFLIERKGIFLDPAVYQEGREVTMIGEITEERKGKIGTREYRYPYVVSDHIHLWEPKLFPGNSTYAYYPYDSYGYAYECYPYPYYWYGRSFYGRVGTRLHLRYPL